MTNILIVDDSSTIRKVIMKFMMRAGLPSDGIHEAVDGVQALEILADKQFDLIFSDINMPNMDGIEFIATVRKKGITTPIITVSSEGDEEQFLSVLKAGAGGCFKKSLFVYLLDQFSALSQQPQEPAS